MTNLLALNKETYFTKPEITRLEKNQTVIRVAYLNMYPSQVNLTIQTAMEPGRIHLTIHPLQQ